MNAAAQKSLRKVRSTAPQTANEWSNLVINDHIHIERFGWTMVEARMLLLSNATQEVEQEGMGSSERDKWYLFFSESCAPIGTCEQAHSYLRHHAGKSFIDTERRPLHPLQLANSSDWTAAFREACPGCADAGILPEHYRFSPGWVGLWHPHALQFLALSEATKPAFTNWTYNKVVHGIQDETYWSTVSTKLQIPLWPQLLTYMEAGNAATGHSASFTAADLPRLSLLTGNAHKHKRRWFFARKFHTTPEIDTELTKLRQPCSVPAHERSGACSEEPSEALLHERVHLATADVLTTSKRKQFYKQRWQACQQAKNLTLNHVPAHVIDAIPHLNLSFCESRNRALPHRTKR